MREELISCSAGLLILAGGIANAQETPKEQPNIIMLLVDDLGWKDVGFNGSRFYETPNIDRLAAKSMIFNNAYAACAVSSPTRASLQTGRYPARIGVTDWIRARFQIPGGKVETPPPYEENGDKKLRTPSNPYWMDLEEITIAELLKTKGYFTCHVGKWHLGPDDYYPEKQGYDVNIAGCDMGQPVNYFDPYADKKGVSFPNLKPRKEGEYLEDRLADELIQVVKQHKDRPFFINMCYYAVHTPLMAKPETIKKYEAKIKTDDQTNAVYASMIEHLDDAVGKLINVLENEGLMDNTIIIFFSDNGGFLGSTSNKPLRSGKGYPYEGGIKEPMFVYWKNVIKPGTQCDLLVSSIDFLPTICKITGTPLPDRIIDGRDISPVFSGKKLKNVPLYWHFPHYRVNDIVPYSIIRDGDWKLIKRYEGTPFELYNLKKDISETNDLASTKSHRVRKLNRKLEEWLVQTEARMPVEK
ncbi:MAG TPA: sulfatase [Bacteroidales bacterium]|nr:sulfatase [Bacteroidales bacterium]HCI55544.1 sulfatase [Bacteroidales bacterium]HOU97088.1 sulfatase [Bacteroidales bacterium]HQG37060.1 sulfatase [Bacteroidales bacterium]HQG52143.1 sulfatase [Bacteroidales bacterium]